MSTETPTLYQRLGHAEGIARIVRDAMAAHLANPLIRSRFLAAKDLDRAERMAVEFFCAGSGGTEAYTGKDLLTAHTGMNVSEQEYMAAMDDIVGALRGNDVDERTQADVVAILYSLKSQVIRV
jgi:hemoglobin